MTTAVPATGPPRRLQRDSKTDIFFFRPDTGSQYVWRTGDGTFDEIDLPRQLRPWYRLPGPARRLQRRQPDNVFLFRSGNGSQVVRLSNGDGTFGYSVICQDGCGVGYLARLADFNGTTRPTSSYIRAHRVPCRPVQSGPLPDLVSVVGTLRRPSRSPTGVLGLRQYPSSLHRADRLLRRRMTVTASHDHQLRLLRRFL